MDRDKIRSRHMWLFVLLFFVGATSRYDLVLFARIPVSELLAFLLLPLVLQGVPLKRFWSALVPVFAVLIIWAFSILLSDLVNGLDFSRFLKALAKPIWCMLWMFFFIGVLFKESRAVLLYFVGMILASFQNYFFPQAWTVERITSGGYDSVAYGIAPIVISICVALAALLYGKSRWVSVFFFVVCGVLLGVFGAPRSNIALMMFNALIVALIWWNQRGVNRLGRVSLKKLMMFVILGVSACWLIYEAYIMLASEGWLGEYQRNKLIDQTDTVFGDSILGIIVGGRTRVFGAILAIMDNPIFGYGSWNAWLLGDYYYDAVAYVGTSAKDLSSLSTAGIISSPGHSILFQSWMENGILAAFSLLVIGYWMLKDLILLIQKDDRLAPVLIYLFASFFWAYLFSPFGVQHRLTIGLFLAIYLMRCNEFSPFLYVGGFRMSKRKF